MPRELQPKGDKRAKAISRRIVRRCKKLDLRQVDLARLLAIDRQLVHAWFAGLNAPLHDQFANLAHVLECRPEWLMTGSLPEEPSQDHRAHAVPPLVAAREELAPAPLLLSPRVEQIEANYLREARDALKVECESVAELPALAEKVPDRLHALLEV